MTPLHTLIIPQRHVESFFDHAVARTLRIHVGAFAESSRGKQAIDSMVYVIVQFARNFIRPNAGTIPKPVCLASGCYNARPDPTCVHPQIAWAELRALRDGAAIASKKLWS